MIWRFSNSSFTGRSRSTLEQRIPFRLPAEHDVRGRGDRAAEGGGGGGADGLGLGGPGTDAPAARLPQELGRAEGTDSRGGDLGEGRNRSYPTTEIFL